MNKVNLKNHLNVDVAIIVKISQIGQISQTGDPPPKSVRVKLSICGNENLSNIRNKLKEKEIEMIDTLLFATKGLVEIVSKDEEITKFDEIIEKVDNENILNLIENSQPNWKFFNEKCELESGHTITPEGIVKANKKAFIMKDCKVNKIGAEGCRKETIEFKSDEEMTMKTEIAFTVDIDVPEFSNFGLSYRRTKDENSMSQINSTCDITEFGKISLKFSEHLEPTKIFINEVKGAIGSKNPREGLKEIIKEYGQFISKEVILGGRAYSKGVENLKESRRGKAKNGGLKAGALNSKIGIEHTLEHSDGNTNYSKSKWFKLIGGKQPNNLTDFDEPAWADSLNDFKVWNCIGFKDPISIFQLLPDDLREEIILALGKRIIYLDTVVFNYTLEAFGRYVYELKNIPSHILKIIQNKSADCSIFATVIDRSEVKNDFFSCQIYCPPEEKPSLIIHCIQDKFRGRECNLRIGWMVIGYYTDFNFILRDFDIKLEIQKHEFNTNNPNNQPKHFLDFKCVSLMGKDPSCIGIPVLSRLECSNNSPVIGHYFFREDNKIGTYTYSYCLKGRQYVDLPNFTLCTLIISSYPPNTDNYGVLPFESKNYSLKLKFISLYSMEKGICGPIFPKQKNEKIKKKHIKCIKCCKKDCICRNNVLSNKDLKYAFFAPEF